MNGDCVGRNQRELFSRDHKSASLKSRLHTTNLAVVLLPLEVNLHNGVVRIRKNRAHSSSHSVH